MRGIGRAVGILHAQVSMKGEGGIIDAEGTKEGDHVVFSVHRSGQCPGYVNAYDPRSLERESHAGEHREAAPDSRFETHGRFLLANETARDKVGLAVPGFAFPAFAAAFIVRIRFCMLEAVGAAVQAGFVFWSRRVAIAPGAVRRYHSGRAVFAYPGRVRRHPSMLNRVR